MRELEPILAIVSFAYAAVGVGVVSALLARAWTRRQGRPPSAAEAGWCVFLPPLALLLLPLATIEPHLPGSLSAVHERWHEWQQTLHSAPLTHGILHAANCLLLAVAAAGMVRMAYALARIHAFASAIRTAASAGALSRLAAVQVEGAPLQHRFAAAFVLHAGAIPTGGLSFHRPAGTVVAAPV
jgi:hypothetical protein